MIKPRLFESLIQGELARDSLVEIYSENDKLKYRPIPLKEIEDALLMS